VQVLSDRSGAFTRLLGLEQPAGPEGPPCQRFAAVVDNGILLRLVRPEAAGSAGLVVRGQ
jgi:peroxiredoxin